MFSKHISVSIAEDEVSFQTIAADIGFSPKIHDVVKGSAVWIVTMDDLNSDNTLSNIYGEDPNKIPEWIWNEIRYILNTLVDHGIEYVDITPYNFMEVDNKIFVIDFGDATYLDDGIPSNWFLKEFLDGYNGWNPDFS